MMYGRKTVHPTSLLLILMVSVLCATRMAAAQEEPRTLTLEQAVALTLRHNTQIRSAYLQRELDAFALKVAGREFTPLGTFSLSANDAINQGVKNGTVAAQTSASLKTITGGSFSALWSQSFSQPANGFGSQSSATLSFSQPLLKGAGLSINRINQLLADRAEQANIQTLRTTLISTVTSVIFNYRSFVLAQQQLEIAAASIERMRENLKHQHAKLKLGKVAANDVIQLENSLARSELGYRRQQNSVEDQRVNLLSLMNVDRQMRIRPVIDLDIQQEALQVDQLQQLARRYSPSYLQGLLNLANQETRLQQAEDNQLWDARLTADYSINAAGGSWRQTQQQLGQRQQGNYGVGITLSIPLGDLTREQAYLAARIARETAEMNWRDTEEQLNVNIETRVRSVNLTWESIALAKQVTELSRKQLQGETIKYQTGSSSTNDLIIAQDNLVQAENSEISAKIDYLNALTSLHQLLGTTLRQWQIDINQPQGDSDE